MLNWQPSKNKRNKTGKSEMSMKRNNNNNNNGAALVLLRKTKSTLL